MTGGASVRVWCFTSQALCFAAQRNNALRHKDTSQQGEARSIPDRPFFCCPHKRAFGASWHTQRASVPCACWADSEATLNRANSEVHKASSVFFGRLRLRQGAAPPAPTSCLIGTQMGRREGGREGGRAVSRSPGHILRSSFVEEAYGATYYTPITRQDSPHSRQSSDDCDFQQVLGPAEAAL